MTLTIAPMDPPYVPPYVEDMRVWKQAGGECTPLDPAIPVPQWQPIATAPRDGTRILLGLVGSDGKIEYVDTGSWEYFSPDDEPQEEDEEGEELAGPGEPPGLSDNFEEDGYWSWVVSQDMDNPTHWLPLQETPV